MRHSKHRNAICIKNTRVREVIILKMKLRTRVREIMLLIFFYTFDLPKICNAKVLLILAV